MAEPIAYFLTWTTYGTWLHGDERLSVDRRRNQRGTPRIAPSEALRSMRRELIRHDPVVLDDTERQIVHRAVKACADRRGWRILALNVRTNHVHCVIHAAGKEPDRVLGDLKAWPTRYLRKSGLCSDTMKVWTRGGSTRWVHDDKSLAAAFEYVLHQQ